MDAITRRFLKFFDHLVATGQTKNPATFAAKIGISNSFMTEIKKNRSNAGSVLLTALITHFKTINCNWLFYGTGAMLLEPEDGVAVEYQEKKNCIYVNIKARAGYLTGYGDPEFIDSLPAADLPQLPRGTAYRMFEVDGDSMAPLLKNKDTVICRSLSRSGIKDNKVCVVACTDGLLVKRIFNRVKEEGVLILKSENQEIAGQYPDLRIPADDVMEVWQVINRISDLR